MMPSIGKSSIIVPVPKKEGQEPTLSNIRPISLQVALTKALSKALANRLGAIFAQYPILHCAQEGFLVGGSTMACIDVLIDLIEQSKQQKSGFFALFYDIAKAYDAVDHSRLLLSLRRINLPESFVEFVADSLSGLQSRVRTAYGLSGPLPVSRSVRQGDPLAPLLFVIFVDSLHCGLDRNPLFGNRQDGIVVNATTRIASKGYADDTSVFSSSISGLQRLNHWVESWMKFNRMSLNGNKTELIGRMANGTDLVNVAGPSEIRVSQHLVVPKRCDESIRYLGILINVNLKWNDQIKSIGSLLGQYCNLAEKHKLGIDQSVLLFNVFLLPKVEYKIRYAYANTETLAKWDKIIAASISRLSGLPRKLKPEAVAVVTKVILPSQLAKVIGISETFYRLNGKSQATSLSRGRWEYLKDGIRFTNSNRLSYARKCLKDLEWSWFRERRNCWGQDDRFPNTAKDFHIDIGNQSFRCIYDYCGSWGSALGAKPREPVVVYTDASAKTNGADPLVSSSWALCVADEMFEQSYRDIPRESEIDLHHVSMLAWCGGKIENATSLGNYMAELQAILRAMLAFPAAWQLDIRTDSKSSIDAINRYRGLLNHRTRLRMPGRPLLALIDRAVNERIRNGGQIEFNHVKAHTDCSEVHSVGNRVADYFAARAMEGRGGIVHQSRKQLPLAAGEAWIYLRNENQAHISTDIRREAMARTFILAREVWSESNSQARFVRSAMNEVYQSLIAAHRRDLLPCLMAVATDTVNWGYEEIGSSKRNIIQQMCKTCSTLLDVSHMLECKEELDHRRSYGQKLRDVCLQYPMCQDWFVKVDQECKHNSQTIWDLTDRIWPNMDGTIQQMFLRLGAVSNHVLFAGLIRIGICSDDIRQTVVHNLRVVLFEHIWQIWKRKVCKPAVDDQDIDDSDD
jgi:ribonuclease HI